MPIALPNDSTETLALALPNDSTLTLVPPPTSFHTVLTLSSDSVLNTTFAAHGAPIYKLKSNSTATRTDVIRCAGGERAEDEVVGSLDRGLLGDSIVRPDGKKTKVGKWAKTVGKKAACVSALFACVRRLTLVCRAASGFDQLAAPMIFASGEEVYVWIVTVPGQMAVRPPSFVSLHPLLTRAAVLPSRRHLPLPTCLV
jgi:hypothetical protein